MHAITWREALNMTCTWRAYVVINRGSKDFGMALNGKHVMALGFGFNNSYWLMT